MAVNRGRKPRGLVNRSMPHQCRKVFFKGKPTGASGAWPEKASASLIEEAKAKLAAQQVRILDLKAIKSCLHAGPQGMERFVLLSMGEKELIQRLAVDYAKVFNAGYYFTKAGQETYFTEQGKETYCFSSLAEIGWAPENARKFCEKMRLFYESISMNDRSARQFFINKFGESLNQKLRPIFEKAIRWAYMRG